LETLSLDPSFESVRRGKPIVVAEVHLSGQKQQSSNVAGNTATRHAGWGAQGEPQSRWAA